MVRPLSVFNLLNIVDRTIMWPEAIYLISMAAELILEAFIIKWVARFGESAYINIAVSRAPCTQQVHGMVDRF